MFQFITTCHSAHYEAEENEFVYLLLRTSIPAGVVAIRLTLYEVVPISRPKKALLHAKNVHQFV